MNLPRIYLSSRFTTNTELETDFLKRTGCRYRCFAYANLNPVFGPLFAERIVQSYEVCLARKIGIMMDSSAPAIHRMQQASKQRGKSADRKKAVDIEVLKEQMFQGYSAFCKENKDKWNFYITLDYKRHQPTIYAMQQRFHSIGLEPVPVYHGDDRLDWLSKHAAMGHKLICLATSRDLRSSYSKKRRYLDAVFNYGEKHGLQFHGLAFTSMAFLSFYPWFSVDSSSWSKMATYGTLCVPNYDRNLITSLHISVTPSKSPNSYNNLNARGKEGVRSLLRQYGFEYRILSERSVRGNHERHVFNGWVFSNLDKLGLDWASQRGKKVEWSGLL